METEYKEKIEKLGDALTKLTLDLQKEVKELKEDTLVNAAHIKTLKTKHTKSINVINNKLKEHVDNAGQMSESLAEINEEQEGSNYENFLKSLLESDFKALQQEMLKEAKREILAKKPIVKAQGKFNIGIIFNAFGLVGVSIDIVDLCKI